MSDQASSTLKPDDTHPAAGESSPPGFRRYDRFVSILRAGTLTRPPELPPAERRIIAAMIEQATNRAVRLLVLLTELDGVQLTVAAKAIGMTERRARGQLASLRRVVLRVEGRVDAHEALEATHNRRHRVGKRVLDKGRVQSTKAPKRHTEGRV